MAPLLVNSAGVPEPSSDIQRRLKQVHHGLSLRYTPAAQQCWLITMDWERNDPRWEMVKRQEMDPKDTWDVIGYLPVGCSPDEAPSYLEKSLRSYPKEEVKRLGERIHHYNDGLRTTHIETAMHEVMQGNPAEFESRKVTGKRTRHAVPKPS